MKIVYICNEYPPKISGGIGVFTKLMAERLAAEGHEIIVFGYGENALETVELESTVKVIRLVEPRFGKNLFLNFFKTLLARYTYFKSLKNHLKGLDIDIIESYDWSGPLLFQLKRVKHIVRLHGSNTANNDYMNKKRSVLYLFIEKRALKIANYIVSVSNHVTKQTKESFKLNFPSTTIYNGVDLAKFQDRNLIRDLNKIILVGRMHDYKGFKELFAALNDVFAANETVHFDVICSIIDSYKEKILRLVDTKYHDRINFIGRVENALLPKKYSEANLSILPSLTEAFPIIPLESMACGTPVIMSNRFSSNEIIDDGEDGFLVNVIDPKEFADGILKAISIQSRIECMRVKASKKIVTNFDIKKIVQENVYFYQSILDKK